jgi:hypothetical protein
MRRIWLGRLCVVVTSFTALAGGASDAKRVANSATQASAVVDLFHAAKAGQIEVRLIPQDSKSGTVIITNNTTAPLSIKLPEAFAGVPVLAQRRAGGAAGGIGGNVGGVGSGNQGIAGGFGGGGLGGGGGGGLGGGGGGVFNIGPERVVKLKFVAVCLEHGKHDPTPRVPYELVPIESFTSDLSVIELAKMLARGEIDQPATQAAAWHLANGLSWQQLADKIGVKHISGTTEPYFSSVALETARQLALEAVRRANRAGSSPSSPGEASHFHRP